MKKSLTVLAIAMLFIAPLYASCGYGDAFDEAEEQIWDDPNTGYRWCYKSSGDAAKIVRHQEWNESPVWPKPNGNFTIPDKINNLSVVCIGYMAFYGCDGLTEITLPNSVTNIGECAFNNCHNMTRVTLSANLINIEQGAFGSCHALTSITIPNRVTRIGGYAFEGCTSLTSMTIPATVEIIGEQLFDGCSNLKTVTFQGTEIEIDDETLSFRGCSSLESYTLPNKITGESFFLGVDFTGCSSLTNIAIPTNITLAALAGCSNLVSVSFPESFMAWGRYNGDGGWYDESFSECYKLKMATFNGKPPLGFVTSLPDEEYVFALDGSSGFMSLCLHADAIYYSAKYKDEWEKVLRNIGYGGVSGVIGSEGATTTTGSDARYDLSNTVKDRTITSVTINNDVSINDFVLMDGKVYDTVLRIVNTADDEVRVSLPDGYEYETVKGATPLTIPANSKNILTITRTADNVFLVSRRELETVQ